MRIAAANIALRETTGVTLRAACRPVSAQVRSIGWSPGRWLGIARFTARFNIVLALGLVDLCDLYAFQSPTDASRTVIILNANPNADALHPDAIYRLNIDNDGDLLTDVALSYVFSKPQHGKQTFNVFLAKGAESRSVEAVGNKIVADAEVSFGPRPNLVKAGDYTFFAGSRSDAFFFDFDGIKNLFDIRGKRNFTEPHLSGKSPWTRVDSNTEANVFSMVVELPTAGSVRACPLGETDPKSFERSGHFR